VCLLVYDNAYHLELRPAYNAQQPSVKLLPHLLVAQQAERASSVDDFRAVQDDRFIWSRTEDVLLEPIQVGNESHVFIGLTKPYTE
jgi:hypothetical protein